MTRLLLCSALLSTALCPALAQEDKLNIEGLNFRAYPIEQFIEAVQQDSAALKSKTLAIQSAEATATAMAFPNLNPSLTYSRGAYYGSIPYASFTAAQSDTFVLSFMVEGWGKRESRKDFGQAEVRRNEVELNWYRRNLESEALMLYIDSLRLKQIWLALRKEGERMAAVPNGQDAQKESRRLQGSLAKEIRYLSHALVAYLPEGTSTVPEPMGRLDIAPRDFDAETLIRNAYDKRADLNASESAMQSAGKSLEMAEKSHQLDITPSVWYSRTPAYSTYGVTTAYGFSLTVPIPTASLYRSDVLAASHYKTQMENNLNELKKRVRMEIHQAMAQYQNAKEQLSSAEKAHQEAVAANKNNVDTMVSERQKEVDLIDARTNHLKALINVLRLSGDYSLPNL